MLFLTVDKLYDEIEEIETLIEEVEIRLYNIRQEKISGDNVYQFFNQSFDSQCFSMGKKYTNWIGTMKVPLSVFACCRKITEMKPDTIKQNKLYFNH